MKLTVWSKYGEREFKETLLYWAEHNASIDYSLKLREEVNRIRSRIGINPAIGKPTRVEGIRTKLVMEHFIFIYRINKQHVRILRFWDTRRNPRGIKRYL